MCSCEKKPQMVDKNLETDREVTLEYVDIEETNFEIAKHENVLIDLIEQKRAADMSDKVIKGKIDDECPAIILSCSFRFARCAVNFTRKTFFLKNFRNTLSHTSALTIPVKSSFSEVSTISS